MSFDGLIWKTDEQTNRDAQQVMKSNSESDREAAENKKKEWESVSEGCSWTETEKDRVIVAYIYLYVTGAY